MSSNIDKVVGTRIARARRRRGWEQRRLAEEVKRSESWISQVERGARTLDSLEMAETIATVLGIDVAYVLAFDVRYRVESAQPTLQIDLAQSEADWMRTLRRTLMAGAGGLLAGAAVAANPLAPHGFSS